MRTIASGAIALLPLVTGSAMVRALPWALRGPSDRALAAAALALASVRRAAGGSPSRLDPAARLDLRERLALGMLLLGSVAAIGFVFATSRWHPWGEWDAWAIWNLRARFLVRAPGAWELFRTPELEWSQMDYPLLLPGAVARAWFVAGESDVVPSLLAAGFAVCGALAAFGLAGAGARTVPASVAALAVLASPPYLAVSGYRVADVPLAALLASSLGLLAVGARDGVRGPVLLAGVAAGLAAWTKNEGLLMVAALGTSLLLRPRLLAPFIAGAAPVLLLVALFKLSIAGPSYLVQGATGSALLERALDATRHAAVARGYLARFLAISAVPLLPVAALLAAGLRLGRPPAWAALALALVVAGDYAVYLATPRELAWQLGRARR